MNTSLSIKAIAVLALVLCSTLLIVHSDLGDIAQGADTQYHPTLSDVAAGHL